MNIVLELHHSKSLKYYFLYASQRTISNCTLFFSKSYIFWKVEVNNKI